MTEDLAVKTIKNILLNGNNVRGKEAENNLRWTLQEYLKEQLILHGVIMPKGTLCDGMCKVEATINAKEQCVMCGNIHKQ